MGASATALTVRLLVLVLGSPRPRDPSGTGRRRRGWACAGRCRRSRRPGVQLADDLGSSFAPPLTGAVSLRESSSTVASPLPKPARTAGRVDVLASVHDDLDTLAAGAGLELVGGATGDDPAMVDDAMSCARRSASSRYCVVSSRVVPPATRPSITSHSSCRLRGSRPVVGSSMNMTGGETTSAAARLSRRRIPPEYVLAVRSAASPRSNRSSSTPARAFAPGPQLVELPDHLEVLPAGQILVDGGELPGQADRTPYLVGLLEHVHPGHGAAAVRGAAAWSARGPRWSCPRRSARAGRGPCPPGRRDRRPPEP
ncbi:hypothetical protein SBADM41S_11376 [Streptomyces badius]